MSLIIGSTAIKYYYPDFNRIPKDLDIAVKEYKQRDNNVEYLVNPVILQYQSEGHLRPNLLLSLKISHLFWDINWEKHLYDVQFLLKKDVKYDVNLIKKLLEYWKITLPKVKRSELNMTKEDFFTNSINKDEHEHDYLHTLLANPPTYTKFLKEGCEVEVCENKWNESSFEDKHNAVFEETAIMAYERYKSLHYRSSYKIQLKNNIQKHFPFWMALYSIVNYPVLEKPIYNFKQKIENGLQIN